MKFRPATLADIAVYGGLGVGKGLLRLARDWLFSLGNKKVMLTTAADTRADRFYRTQGWERGETKDDIEVFYTLHRGDGV